MVGVTAAISCGMSLGNASIRSVNPVSSPSLVIENRLLLEYTPKGNGASLSGKGKGWTVTTRDRKPAAHFEYAVAVGKDGPDVLTDFSIIEQAINK